MSGVHGDGGGRKPGKKPVSALSLEAGDPAEAVTPSRASKAVKAADVAAAVQALAEPIIHGLGLVLDRIEYLDRGRSAVLQVFIDRPAGDSGSGGVNVPGGVNVKDCADVSRELSPTLDVHDVVPKAYTLEVSSPGLDRPLKGEDDLRRFAGRRASLTLRQAVEGGSKLIGVLRGVEDGKVAVELKDGRVVKIDLGVVAKGRLEPEA